MDDTTAEEIGTAVTLWACETYQKVKSHIYP